MEVQFQVGERYCPKGYKGIPEGPTPCYAVLKEKGQKRKVLIHPAIFKTEILRSNDGNAHGLFYWRPSALCHRVPGLVLPGCINRYRKRA